MSPVTQYIVQAGLTLVGIGLLAYLLLSTGRRWTNATTRGPLELVGRLPLEGRRVVYLVRVESRLLVLGATDQHIAKLAELAADEVSLQTMPPDDFKSIWARVTGRARADDTSSSTRREADGTSSSPRPCAEAPTEPEEQRDP